MSRQNLTTNACTVCRRKRTKCDGCQPCRRCVSRGEDCVYEDKMWQTKDHLRSEIARLRREVQQCHGLIEALTGGSTAEGWRTIQSFMRRGDSPEQIAAWINTSRSPSGILGAGVSPEQAEQQTVSPGSSSHSIIPESCGPPKTSSRPYPSASSDTAISAQSSSEDGHVSTAPDAVSPAASDALCCLAAYASSGTRTTFLLDGHVSTIPRSLSSWAGLTQDTELLYSLLQHYFDNCFPNYSFICKERFMMDVDEKTGMYCSSALLHAILGFASQSYSPSSDIASDSGQSSRFLAQAKELLSTGKGGISITDIQATGVLALAEANRGNDAAAMESANDCVRKAVVWKIKMASGGVRTEDPGYREAMAATFCGAISLARIFRILNGRLSCQSGPLFMRLTPDKENSAIDSPAARVERGETLQQHFFSELEHCSALPRFINTVTEIAHSFCSYHQDGAVSPTDLIPAYDKCLQAWQLFRDWFSRHGEMDKDVLFAQIWYNYILTVLCSTLMYTKVNLREETTPMAMVIRASGTVIFLAGVYQQRFGFVAVHPLLPHMVFAATLVHLRRPFDGSHIIGQATTGTTTCSTRKRHCSETLLLSPTATAPTDRLGNGSPNDAQPRVFRRTSSQAVPPPTGFLLYPPWSQHLAPATLRYQAAAAGEATIDDVVKYETDATTSPLPQSAYSVRPSSKRAAELVAQGTLHLSTMGATNRKAAALAKALRAKCAARPVPAIAIGGVGPLPHWTPAWAAVNWGAQDGGGTGIGAGSCGLATDQLQDVAAVTTTGHAGGGAVGVLGGAPTENVAAAPGEYTLGVVGSSGCIGGPQDGGLPRGAVGDTPGAASHAGLYVWPDTLPLPGCAGSYRGFVPEGMDGVAVAPFAGLEDRRGGLLS